MIDDDWKYVDEIEALMKDMRSPAVATNVGGEQKSLTISCRARDGELLSCVIHAETDIPFRSIKSASEIVSGFPDAA